MSRHIGNIGKGIKGKLFISFLVITLLISILISISAYFITFNIIKEKVSISFSLMMDYVSNSVNSQLQQIRSFTDYLFVSPAIKRAIIHGDEKTIEAVILNDQAYDTIKQYAISHIFENINNITISGLNGYNLNYTLNYSDLVPGNMPVDDWKSIVASSNGELRWVGLTSRVIRPGRKDSNVVNDITLIRPIKSMNYQNSIGMMYISINPRAFLNLIQTYDNNYPDYARDCRIYILDNNNNIINSDDGTWNREQLSLVLNSKEAYTDRGLMLSSQDCIAFVNPATTDGWKVVGTIPLSLITSDNMKIFYISVIAFILCVVTCSLIWFYLSSGIFRPLKNLAGTMKQIENGNMSLRVSINTDDEIGSLGRNFNSMLERMEQLYSQNLDKEIRIKDAEYRALQAQINPHFLYNTLNSMRWMAIMINADNIKNAIDAFWTITKYSTGNNERFITVDQEINIVKQYVALQKIAYGNKFDVVWNIDDSITSCKCIKFFLQPLVENSIMHGILPRNSTGMIYINIYPEDGSLVFNVYDDGAGMSVETINTIFGPDGVSGKKRIGLPNIIERIKYAYNDQCSIDISSELNHYTNIMIKTPLVI